MLFRGSVKKKKKKKDFFTFMMYLVKLGNEGSLKDKDCIYFMDNAKIHKG